MTKKLNEVPLMTYAKLNEKGVVFIIENGKVVSAQFSKWA